MCAFYKANILLLYYMILSVSKSSITFSVLYDGVTVTYIMFLSYCELYNYYI